jgi:hypothetical protein
MTIDPEENGGLADTRNSPLEICLEAVPSTIKKSSGGAIHFTRAVLVIKNVGLEPVQGLTPRAVLTQENGMSHEVTAAMARELKDDALPPGGTIQWDLFGLLADGHPGVASKVHLFGYKTALNWWFTVSAEADYRLGGGSSPRRTPPFKARFRWNAKPNALDEVDLSIQLH